MESLSGVVHMLKNDQETLGKERDRFHVSSTKYLNEINYLRNLNSDWDDVKARDDHDYQGDDAEERGIDARDAAGVGALADIPAVLTCAEKNERVGLSLSPSLPPCGRVPSFDKGGLHVVDAAKKPRYPRH